MERQHDDSNSRDNKAVTFHVSRFGEIFIPKCTALIYFHTNYYARNLCRLQDRTLVVANILLLDLKD